MTHSWRDSTSFEICSEVCAAEVTPPGQAKMSTPWTRMANRSRFTMGDADAALEHHQSALALLEKRFGVREEVAQAAASVDSAA